MKTLLRLVLAVVVLVIVAVVAVFFYIDSIARTAVEKGATYALGVPTTLAKADVGVMAGRFDMAGLNVHNPSGFDTAHFLLLNKGGVLVSLGSLRSDMVELPELALSGIDVNLESKGGKANYKVVLDNLKKLEGESTPGQPSAGGGKKFIVRKIDIRDIKVHVSLLPIGGQASTVEVPIDHITLKDVGTGAENGANLSDLSSLIMKAIFTAVLQKGGDLVPKDIAGELGGALAGLKNMDKFGVEVAGQALQDLGKAGDGLKGVTEGGGDLGKKVEEAAKGLGGLFGGDKKKE